MSNSHRKKLPSTSKPENWYSLFSSLLCISFHFNYADASMDIIHLLEHCQSGTPGHENVRSSSMIFKLYVLSAQIHGMRNTV